MKQKLGRLCSSFLVLSLLVASGFTLISGKQIAYAATLTIEQNTIGNIFYENDTKSFKIYTDGDSVNWVYSDYWDNTVQSGSQAVSGGSVLITVNPGKKGWFKLVITAKQNGSVIASQETSFAVVSNFDLNQVVDSPFSVQTHAARTDLIAQDPAALLPIAKKMGVKYVRDALRWEYIEDTTKGVYNFTNKPFLDNFMSGLKSNALMPYITLALYNDLYDGGNAPTSPEARMAFANYGKQVLARYPQIGQVEIWNEPDIPTFGKGLTTEAEKADFYFNLLKTSYEQIHPDYPNVKITGFVFGDQGSDSFLESLYQKGALNYLSEYSFHAYPKNPEDIVTDINRHRNIMKKYNNNQTIPMNLSETGFTNYNTEHVQANYVARRIVTALAAGIHKINIYNLQNKSTDPKDFEGTYGLIRNPGDVKGAYVPKPAYVAYAAMTRELTGANFQTTENVASGIYIHKFQKGMEDIRVMYSPAGAEVKLFTHGSLNVTDIMGNTQTYSPTNGYVRLRLDENPLYVKGGLEAPYIEEIPAAITYPITLYYGYNKGGYTEVNGTSGEATNKWVASSVLKSYDGGISRAITNPTGASAKWTPTIVQPGRYRITAYLPGTPATPVNTTNAAEYTIYINGEEQQPHVVIDQTKLQGSWQVLGTYEFPKGTGSSILLKDANPAHNHPLRADVMKLESILPTGISLDTATLNLRVGDTHAFTAVFTPAEATEQTLIWSSSNSQVVTVDTEGHVNATGEGEAVIRATNLLSSLYAEAKVKVTQVDTTAPTTTDDAPKNWVNKDVTITLKSTDSGSGVDATFYKVDSVAQQKGNSVNITDEGEHTLIYWSIDNAGNIEAQHTATVKIDKTVPVSITSVSPAAPNGSNGWYTSDVTVGLAVYDNLSGVASTEYQVNDGAWTAYAGSIPAFGEGVHKVNYRSTDQAGNVEKTQTIEFKVDKTAPILNVQLDKMSLWPPNHKMVTVHAQLNSSDAGSGVASMELTSITSNEPDSGQGDIGANFGTAATSFNLRADRSGSGTGGRIYTITYTIADNAGNKWITSKTVTVPHDQSGYNNQSGNY
ncbi:OmpL47-type beta-barrel domain-containing protein [Paenibacillus ferrarius]|nr:Ig-like domain-containing protein [Paenibacillus ferrarius]